MIDKVNGMVDQIIEDNADNHDHKAGNHRTSAPLLWYLTDEDMGNEN